MQSWAVIRNFGGYTSNGYNYVMNSPNVSASDHDGSQSNPFKLVIAGLNQLYDYNRWPALVLIALGFFASVSQFTSFKRPGAESGGGSPVATGGGQINPAVAMAVIFLLVCVVILLMVYVSGTLSYIGWKSSRRERVTFREAIAAVNNHFWTIAGLYAQTLLRVFGGLLLLVVPGIRALLRYRLAIYQIFEDDITTGEALKRSRQLSRNHLVEIWGVISAAAIIPVFTLALQTGGEALLFQRLKSRSMPSSKHAVIHWTNYLAIVLGVIILGGLALLPGFIR